MSQCTISQTGVHIQGILQMLVDLHDGSLIAASVAVIGGAENRYHVPVLAPIVSLHDQLMCSGNQR